MDEFLSLSANKPQLEYQLAQVMISSPENASPEQIQSRRTRIVAARQELAEGKEFAAVAATYSTAAEASNGGVIGWRPTGALAPAFAELLESLQPGEMTDISAAVRVFTSSNCSTSVSRAKSWSSSKRMLATFWYGPMRSYRKSIAQQTAANS